MRSAGHALPTGAVTFLFTDIEGSTRLWEDDAKAMREALSLHDRIINDSVHGHQGVVFKTGGDSFCASFASPQAALECAIAAQRQLGAVGWPTESPIGVRMGLHTGTAQLRNDDYFGPALNRAARLMAVGHGGQVLTSSATEHLLADELPHGVELLSLGIQYLKDLDRPENIYQVISEGLIQEFPPLDAVAGASANLADRIRVAYKAKQWSKVRDLLVELEEGQELSGELHEMMGFALWWLGTDEKVIDRFEQTYNAYLSESNLQGAAIAAIEIADIMSHNLASEVAAGWIKRAERLLESDEDSVAKGYLLRWHAVRAFERDADLERSLELSRRVLEIGQANSDGNLEVLALQDQGRFLVASGDMDAGMPLMDEAMLAAVAGDANPITVGRSYCNMLAVCDQTGDVRRAAEWSEAANRWCRDHEMSNYPGICRIFKAELMWKNGDWVGAESEVMKASNELGLYNDIRGEAWYQYGEMRLRAGDIEDAENAFQEALTRGREPVPGYALILAHQGDLTSARDLLERALSEPQLSKLDRARFLPAVIQLSLEDGDNQRAEQALVDLAEISELARSDLFKAQASHARGNIELATGIPSKAITELKEATKIYTRLGLPFESATAHADMGVAYIADGAKALAAMELKAARVEFERLGSESNTERMTELLSSTQP